MKLLLLSKILFRIENMCTGIYIYILAVVCDPLRKHIPEPELSWHGITVNFSNWTIQKVTFLDEKRQEKIDSRSSFFMSFGLVVYFSKGSVQIVKFLHKKAQRKNWFAKFCYVIWPHNNFYPCISSTHRVRDVLSIIRDLFVFTQMGSLT